MKKLILIICLALLLAACGKAEPESQPLPSESMEAPSEQSSVIESSEEPSTVSATTQTVTFKGIQFPIPINAVAEEQEKMILIKMETGGFFIQAAETNGLNTDDLESAMMVVLNSAGYEKIKTIDSLAPMEFPNIESITKGFDLTQNGKTDSAIVTAFSDEKYTYFCWLPIGISKEADSAYFDMLFGVKIQQ